MDIKANQRKEQAVVTRQKLLDTAKTMFAQDGYAVTPVRKISKALKMSDGILYHYFPGGKKEMLSVLLAEGLQRSLSAMSKLNDELEVVPLKDALDLIYKKGDLLFTDDMELVKIILKESDNLELNETRILVGTIQERISWFAGFLERRHQKGEIRLMDFHIASQQFLAISINNAIAKLLKIDVFGKLEYAADREAIIEHTLSLWSHAGQQTSYKQGAANHE